MTGVGVVRRIAIDAGALAFPAGGIRRYTRELLGQLPEAAAACDGAVEFVAIGAPDDEDLPTGVERGPRVLALPTNFARAAVALPFAIGRARLDLFHAPAYTTPLVGRTPVVLTIHDVSYARRPEFYAYRSGRARQWFYRESALRAEHIITDSIFSRNEIMAAYGIPQARITVVPLGVGAPFVQSPRPDARLVTRGRAIAGLPAGVRVPFVLHVGDLHSRRNLEMAGRAVIEINRRRAGEMPLQLVCTGRDQGSGTALRSIFDVAGVSEALCLTGPVGELDLLALYLAAGAFVYPSLYEGFGLPVLEAMACGCPVIALRAGSVPEVLGEAGFLVQIGDERGFLAAIEAVVSSPERTRAMGDAAMKRARAFTWARTAKETLAVYLECLDRTDARLRLAPHSPRAEPPHRERFPQ